MLLPETPQIGDFVLVHAGFAIQTIKAEAFQTGEIMHESSIAHSIIEIIDEQCAEHGCTTVDALTVPRLAGHGVMPESLQFAFDALKGADEGEERKAHDRDRAGRRHLQDCKKDFDEKEVAYVFACPTSGSNDFENHPAGGKWRYRTWRCIDRVGIRVRSAE